MSTNFQVRDLCLEDLKDVSCVHMAAFPDRALTMLGKEAVRRYYEWQLTGPHDVTALGIFENKKLAGFCFAGMFQNPLSGFIRKHRVYLFFRVVTHFWLITNELFRDRIYLVIHIFKRLFSRKKSRTNVPTSQPEIGYGILAIAVDPKYQGKGLGKLLTNEIETIAKNRGYHEMDLIVDRENRQAIGFYESLGWEKTPNDEAWEGRMVKIIV